MFTNRQINFVLERLNDEERSTLIQVFNFRSLSEGIIALTTEGGNLSGQDGKYEKVWAHSWTKLEAQYPKERGSDLFALACFFVGYKSRLETETPERRKFLKDSIGLFLATRSNLHFKTPELATVLQDDYDKKVNEENFEILLEKAWQIRRQGNFAEVKKITRSVQPLLKKQTNATAGFWKAQFLDLEVDCLFSISDFRYQETGLMRADAAIKKWYDRQQTAKLLHSFLRKAVFPRQYFMATKKSPYLFECIEILELARSITENQLRHSSQSDEIEALFYLYRDLGNSYSQARDFDKSRYYRSLAYSLMNGFSFERELDIAGMVAVEVRERFIKGVPIAIVNQIEQAVDVITQGLNYLDSGADIVAQTVLNRNFIPLKIALNQRDEASENLKQQIYFARKYNLLNEIRTLQYISKGMHLRL